MGFERNYNIRIHYNQIYIQERLFYSYKTQTKSFVEKLNLTHKMNPWFVTGLVDGEGCFSISLFKDKRRKKESTWIIKRVFYIGLDKRDKALLQEIKSYLGVGKIYTQGSKLIQLRVESIKDLIVIINHFDKYPLKTDKFADYELFKQIVKFTELKEHKTYKEIFFKIVAIKASMNRGLSRELKSAFPDVIPVIRPLVLNKKQIQYPNWLAGFVSAEGSFMVNIKKSSTYKLGAGVELVFQITQHNRDEDLMKSLISYFDCGYIKIRKKATGLDFIVTKFSDINEKIIPFFKKYSIRGVKAIDFADWCTVVELMKEKKHLTAEGLEKILAIKNQMNKGRN